MTVKENGGVPALTEKDSQPHQLFRLLKLDDKQHVPIKNGATYQVLGANASALDSRSSNLYDGTPVTGDNLSLTRNQRFTTSQVNDYFKIFATSGQHVVVSVDLNDKADGSKLFLKNSANGDEQLWKFVPTEGSTMRSKIN